MDFSEDDVPKNICLLANDDDIVGKHEIIDVIKFSNLEHLPNEVHYDVLLYLLTVRECLFLLFAVYHLTSTLTF